MKIAVITFSQCGAALAKRLMPLSGQGHEVQVYIAQRHEAMTGFEPFASIYDLAERLFKNMDALVFIGACGIAVRAVAPLLRSKLYDPAVVVCDETGRFAISLLSGHAGGANQLSEEVAKTLGAVPVITTASDSHAILEGSKGPRNLILGIGCRRGLSAELIERTATILLWDQRIPLERISEVASIDVKRGFLNSRGCIDCRCASIRRRSWRVFLEISRIPNGCSRRSAWIMSVSAPLRYAGEREF